MPLKYRWCIVPTTPPSGIQQDIEIHDARGRRLRDDSQQHENVGHHDRREQLQKVFDPEVHDPEAPEIGNRKIGSRMGQQPHRVEQRDRQRAVEEQVRQISAALLRSLPRRALDKRIMHHSTSPTTSRTCHSRPRSRYSQPWAPTIGRTPGQPALVAGRFSRQAADDDHDQSRQQQERQEPLPARLAAGDDRGQKDSRGQVRGHDEKQRQLQMPGAGQVIGQVSARDRCRKSRRFRRGSGPWLPQAASARGTARRR